MLASEQIPLLCLGDLQETERVPPGRDFRNASRVWLLRYRLTPDFRVFDGHFPGQPVLPAMAQIMLARHGAEQVSGHALRLEEIVQAKFTALVRPEALVVLSIAPPAAESRNWVFRLQFSQDGGEAFSDASQMKIRFAYRERREDGRC